MPLFTLTGGEHLFYEVHGSGPPLFLVSDLSGVAQHRALPITLEETGITSTTQQEDFSNDLQEHDPTGWIRLTGIFLGRGEERHAGQCGTPAKRHAAPLVGVDVSPAC